MSATNDPKHEDNFGETMKKLLNDHPVVVIGGYTAAIFIAGFVSYQTIVGITGSELITKTQKEELESLKPELAKLEEKVLSLQKELEKYQKPLQVTFQSPKNGDSVGWKTTVKGKLSSNLATNQHLWLVVHPEDSSGWWPQNSEIITNSDLTWEQTIYIGRKDSQEDVGRKHDLIVVLADETANQEFNDYLERAQATGDFPSKPLPSNVKILDKITTIRQ